MPNNQKVKLIASAVSALFVGCILGYIFHSYTSDKYSFLSNSERVSSCLDSATNLKDETVNHINNALSFCYRKIWYQGALDDYNVRRIIFQNQYIADIVLLWMVVVITLSGVCLAALQLYTSYELSKLRAGEVGGPAELASSLGIEKGKVVLKSSVTGLFILVISFAFFYIYVILVYKINDPVGSSTPAGQTLSSQLSPQFPVAESDGTLKNGIGNSLQPIEGISGGGGGFGPPPVIEQTPVEK